MTLTLCVNNYAQQAVPYVNSSSPSHHWPCYRRRGYYSADATVEWERDGMNLGSAFSESIEVLLLTFVDYCLLLMTLVMHLCSPCNRRTINFYDDDDDDEGLFPSYEREVIRTLCAKL